MTDDATNGAAPTEAEQQAEMAVQLVAHQTRELLGLLGCSVTDEAGLLAGASAQVQAQMQLSQQILPTFQGKAATENPLFAVAFAPANASTIMLPGQAAPQGFRITGPKQLQPGANPQAVAATLTAILFATNPVYRLVCTALGVQISFQQIRAPQGNPRTPIFKGPARS